MSQRSRFPARVYHQGSEPDARFSLANERTFLAWIRTSLALLAGGVALAALDPDARSGLRRLAVITLISAGVVTPLHAWIGWMRTEAALRVKKPLPAPNLALPVALALLAVGMFVLIDTVL